MGQLLWAELAEGLSTMSEPDHGKIEGMCASGSLAACRCDLMTSDPVPTWRLAKLSHGRERESLSGSRQESAAISKSRCRGRGGCNAKSRGSGGWPWADKLPLGAVSLSAKQGG